ncbi:unnamed protein product [Strongylus vulgaris]|uniref:Protein kinase domain-containing protein n=1 Tax=Strongylus vulgaris TaxID=40348 RepID=A0A3P7JAT9_STRVU|nr:unnamed protein product [Strongylus vulgaris]
MTVALDPTKVWRPNAIQFTFALKNPIKLQPWEYLHSDVKQGDILGHGAFGEVRAGKLHLKSGEDVEVAIKLVRYFLSFNRLHTSTKARLMRNFKHNNIVRIYGVAVDEQPLYILLELVTGILLISSIAAIYAYKGIKALQTSCRHLASDFRNPVGYIHEARLMRNFKHNNIVRIYGVAVDEQPLYILLELVTGISITSITII